MRKKKKNYLKLAKERRQFKNKMNEEGMELDIQNFLCLLYCNFDPASYGKQTEKKLNYDTGNRIKKISPKKDQGEFLIGNKVNEMKTSFLNQSGVFRLANLRPWQKIDNYILFLIDTENDFKLSVFMVNKNVIYDNLKFSNMDNVQSVNDKNEQVNKGTVFGREFLPVLEENNLLRGTDYYDIVEYIKHMNALYDMREKDTISTKAPYVKPVIPVYKPIIQQYTPSPVVRRNKKTSLSVKVTDKLIISGKTNMEVMSKLCKFLGHEYVVGAIWNSQISTYKNDIFKVDIGGGYYLNPKFSIRDFRSMIKNLKNKCGLPLQLIES